MLRHCMAYSAGKPSLYERYPEVFFFFFFFFFLLINNENLKNLKKVQL